MAAAQAGQVALGRRLLQERDDGGAEAGKEGRGSGLHADREAEPIGGDLLGDEGLLPRLGVAGQGAVGEAEPVGLVDQAHDAIGHSHLEGSERCHDEERGPLLERGSDREDARSDAVVRRPAPQGHRRGGE